MVVLFLLLWADLLLTMYEILCKQLKCAYKNYLFFISPLKFDVYWKADLLSKSFSF